MERRLTATEVAARLGVKVETVYAYVSRGHLRSARAADGRTSTFDPAEVERLARRGRPRRSTRGPAIDVVIETAITRIDGEHLHYRGRDATELATTVAFEQVAELLWTGVLPDRVEGWPAGRVSMAEVPAAGLLERLRLALALLGAEAPDPASSAAPDPKWVAARGRELIAAMVDAVPTGRRHRPAVLRLDGDTGPMIRGSIAARLAASLTPGRSTSEVAALVNAALVLLADHELATSTLAARVAASTRAGPDAVVSAGLGPLAGPLHGTASREVRALLALAADTSPGHAVAATLERTDRLPGMGHPLYRRGDPRAATLLRLLREVFGDSPALDVVDATLAEAQRATGVHPNVDAAIAALGAVTGMRPDAGEAIFTVARSAGWLAHAIEEYERTPLRFRARARYVGP